MHVHARPARGQSTQYMLCVVYRLYMFYSIVACARTAPTRDWSLSDPQSAEAAKENHVAEATWDLAS